MDKETAHMLAIEIKREIESNPLHYPDVEIEVVQTIGCGWMVQVY